MRLQQGSLPPLLNTDEKHSLGWRVGQHMPCMIPQGLAGSQIESSFSMSVSERVILLCQTCALGVDIQFILILLS